MKHLPWILLALVLAFPLFAQGQSPMSVVRVSLVGSVPLEMRVPGQPRAKDIVRIQEGAPYTVPPGKILVMTGMGRNSGSASSWVIRADGVSTWRDKLLTQSGASSYSLPIPSPGITATEGQAVAVVFDGQSGVLLGYLEDA